jgi:DUF1365 family protein
MNSAIYVGKVFHSRLLPKKHSFSYRVFMSFLDLDEIDDVLAEFRLLSERSFSPLQVKREDFHGDPSTSIKQAVLDTVFQRTGKRLNGKVCALINLRCFGFNFNPLVVYYCFSEVNDELEAIVAEVTNTPWLERHAYVLDIDPTSTGRHQSFDFDKQFTVSPFNPVNMQYQWKSSLPDKTLSVSINTVQDTTQVFRAMLTLHRTELNSQNLRKVLISFPFITLKVVLAIYWQAFRLFLKGIPFLGKNKRMQFSKI